MSSFRRGINRSFKPKLILGGPSDNASVASGQQVAQLVRNQASAAQAIADATTGNALVNGAAQDLANQLNSIASLLITETL
jgi:hypothetical protein